MARCRMDPHNHFGSMPPSSSVISQATYGFPFSRLVRALRAHGATITVVEGCTGGLVQAGLLSQPGASAVYRGGTIAYNTQQSQPFLFQDAALYEQLLQIRERSLHDDGKSSASERYQQSKIEWTRAVAVAACRATGTDFGVAQNGATGPTFPCDGMDKGFSVVAVAARMDDEDLLVDDDDDNNDEKNTADADDSIRVVHEQIFNSSHNKRYPNMETFANRAAIEVIKAVEKVKGRVRDDQGMEDDVVKNEVGQHDTSAVSHSPNTYRLDRATHIRSKPHKLDILRPRGRFVLLRRNKSLFEAPSDSSQRRLALLTWEQLQDVMGQTQCETNEFFLGLGRSDKNNGASDDEDAQPFFGVDLKHYCDDDEPSEEELVELFTAAVESVYPGSVWEDTRTVAPLLSQSASLHQELVLIATALAEWHRRTQLCSDDLCNGVLLVKDGGTRRECPCCGDVTFPRQDPSMITLVTSRDGQRALLVRSPRHPEGMYTALAGFVEAGEHFEDAVAREVWEETGIRIDRDSIRYVTSQPWPFPQSTMIGFLAQADDLFQRIRLDPGEIVSARWFDRSEVVAATHVKGPVMAHEVAAAALEADPNLQILVPPRGVLARTLIDVWLQEDADPLRLRQNHVDRHAGTVEDASETQDTHDELLIWRQAIEAVDPPIFRHEFIKADTQTIELMALRGQKILNLMVVNRLFEIISPTEFTSSVLADKCNQILSNKFLADNSDAILPDSWATYYNWDDNGCQQFRGTLVGAAIHLVSRNNHDAAVDLAKYLVAQIDKLDVTLDDTQDEDENVIDADQMSDNTSTLDGSGTINDEDATMSPDPSSVPTSLSSIEYEDLSNVEINRQPIKGSWKRLFTQENVLKLKHGEDREGWWQRLNKQRTDIQAVMKTAYVYPDILSSAHMWKRELGSKQHASFVEYTDADGGLHFTSICVAASPNDAMIQACTEVLAFVREKLKNRPEMSQEKKEKQRARLIKLKQPWRQPKKRKPKHGGSVGEILFGRRPPSNRNDRSG